MHKFDFENQTAIITGGAQGFGLDIAKRFLESGCNVFIWDIDENLLKKTTDEINNPNLNYHVVDVSKYAEVEKFVGEITSKNKIDILIDNSLERFTFLFAAAGHPNCVFKIDFKNLQKMTNGLIKDIAE